MTDTPYDHANAVHRLLFRSILHVGTLPDTTTIMELLKGTTTAWKQEELKPYYLPQEIIGFFAARRRILRRLVAYGTDAQTLLNELDATGAGVARQNVYTGGN